MFNRSALIYSRSVMGLDVRVWILLLMAIVISVLLFGFKARNHTDCSSLSVVTQGNMPHHQSNAYYVSEKIIFKITGKNIKKVEWDFGDASPRVTGAEQAHQYKIEGDYDVVAIVNDKCKESIYLTVSQTETSNNSPDLENVFRSPIMGDTYATAGTLETYSCRLPASSYKWTIENKSGTEEKFGQSVSFSFSDTGTYTLVVQLDDDDNKVYKQIITVSPVSDGAKVDPLPKPELVPIILPKKNPVSDQQKNPSTELPASPLPPAPTTVPPPKAAKRYLQLPPEEVETWLKDVVDKKRDVPDFDNVLCEGGNTKVTANGKVMTFSELCKKLQDKKGLVFKSKVKDIKVSSAPYGLETKCMVTIYVKYK
jgi:uncharacterized protein with GYD domain